VPCEHFRADRGPRSAPPSSSTQDVLYIANVTIEGVEYSLQMDTGSSDLWVDMGTYQPSNVVSSITGTPALLLCLGAPWGIVFLTLNNRLLHHTT